MNYSELLLMSPYSHNCNQSYDFYMTDSQTLYEQNLKRYGSQWNWANSTILYKFNSRGYRMKELQDVDYDNYILFLGCSNTVGIGMPLEQTYPHMISKTLGCDYVNAGVGGASVDFVSYNFINFISKVHKLPKAIIVNWPNISRTCYWTMEGQIVALLPSAYGHEAAQLEWVDSYKQFIRNTTNQERRFDLLRENIKFICKNINVLFHEITSDPVIANRYETLNIRNYFNKVDPKYLLPENVYARDYNAALGVGHPGTGVQMNVHDDFIKVYSEQV